MKKLVAILLALALIFAMSTTVFAEETKYNGYQLMTLEIGLKEAAHHPATCDNINHSDDCYNYDYDVNPTYQAILKEEAYNHAGDAFWATNEQPDSVNDVTEENILDYFETLTSDGGGAYGSLRPVADRIYRKILAAGIPADQSNMSSTTSIDENQQGYWLIADVTEDPADDVNSLVMLDTRGANEISIRPKISLPSIEKKVKDIEDSEDASILDNPWQDSADFDIGDKIYFKLEATLPNNLRAYESYRLVFHDKLSAGLTLDPSSIVVRMYPNQQQASVDTDMNDGTLLTLGTDYTVVTADTEDNCSFEIVMNDVRKIEGVTTSSAFAVYYQATLTGDAAIGNTGNANEVLLEFSNNAYGDSTSKTEWDKVKVFTYQLVINKKDSHNHDLEGAGFTLYKKDLSATNVDPEAPAGYTAVGAEQKADGQIQFIWEGIDDGDYILRETTTPKGYNTMKDLEFSISATHSEISPDPELLTLTWDLDTESVNVAAGTITRDVINQTGAALPETGAEGTMFLIGGGAMLVAVAAVFMVTRKKMSIYED